MWLHAPPSIISIRCIIIIIIVIAIIAIIIIIIIIVIIISITIIIISLHGRMAHARWSTRMAMFGMRRHALPDKTIM